MKRALVIGINDYEKIQPLRGCVNDAKSISMLISKNDDGSRNFDTQTVTSEGGNKITKKVMKQMLTDLFTPPADMAFFYFSGHGTATNLGGYLCTYETDHLDEGFPVQELLTLINKAPIKEIVVILDCCNSGRLGSIPALNSDAAMIREGTSILTASRADESAVEINGSGIFTSLVCDALSGSAADLLGTVTPAGVYSHVEQSFGAWEQRPLFKSYVSRSTSLRKTSPKIDREVLRKLTSLFLTQDAIHNLDPSYEHTQEKLAKPENVEKFKLLKKLQTVGLIKVNRGLDPDLYWACMENRSCQLLPLGKFYWHLVNAGKI